MLMDTKSAVLQLLQENKTKPMSGQQIAISLGISRVAVWKAVKSLQEEGYSIVASTNKGYRLSDDCDIVCVQGIVANLPQRYKNIDLQVKESTVSTNIDVAILASNGAQQGTTVVALQQSSGQGRLGKSFTSPKGGLYFSVLIRPTLSIDKAVMITPAAACAVHKAIKDLFGLNVSIKWVNDIYLGSKKVVGISTQAQADFASRGISSIIVGIGINYSTEQSEFPIELQDKAGALWQDNAPNKRNELIALTISNLLDLCQNLQDKNYMDYYRKNCFVIGSEVDYVYDNTARSGKVLDIDDNGSLIIQEYGNPDIRKLSCGEISVKPRF